MKAVVDFENNLKRLEDIVNTLEKEEQSLEETVKLFQEGMNLSKECRKALPAEVPLRDAVYNISHTIALTYALKVGDRELLRDACHDLLHQPYRKNLIKDYDIIADTCFKNQACAFMISGSGPTCMVISNFSNFSEAIQDEIKGAYRIIDLSVDYKGYEITELS